jgi:hypothetical protein
VCLNPGTTDPTAPSSELACNTDAGQGGAIDEGAVWSGSTLTISPTAGLLTQSTSATSGILQVGEFKYLNLDDCSYYGTAHDQLLYSVPATPNANFSAGTTASDTAQSSPMCGVGTAGYAPQALNSGVENIPLLGNRYLNLDQCAYTSPTDSAVFDTPTGNAGYDAYSTASNSLAALSCGAGLPFPAYALQALNSGIDNVDLLGNTVLNLEQCVYDGSAANALTYIGSTPNSPTFDAATGASNATVSSPTCGPGAGGYPFQALNSGVENVNLVDTTRGQGFVQFDMTAPSPPTTTTYTEDGQLTGTGTGDPTTSGTITVDATTDTPLGNPWLAGGAAGIVAATGLALVTRRRRAQD